MTPDVNVLVAASRNDHPHHSVAYRWLSESVTACADGATLKLMPMVVGSFLRLVTNHRIFVYPTPLDNALAFVDALIAAPGVEIPALGAEWPVMRQLCVAHNLTANAIPDAWLAAAVIHCGEHLITFDADFRTLLGRTQLTVLATEGASP